MTWNVITPPVRVAESPRVPGLPLVSVVPLVLVNVTELSRPLAKKRHVSNFEVNAVPAVPPTVVEDTFTVPLAMVFSSTLISAPSGGVASVGVAPVVSVDTLNLSVIVTDPLPGSTLVVLVPTGVTGPGLELLELGTGS